MNVHFSSKSSEWGTPIELFKELDREFHFDLDVCATPQNAKCKKYFTEIEDGLTQNWEGVCWMNPPYGRQIHKWVKKAAESKTKVICLLPSRTDTAWWHDYCIKYGNIRFLRGRIKFDGAKHGAPFPSAIVIFGSHWGK